MQAVPGSLRVISNATPKEQALYPSLFEVERRSLVMVCDVRANRVRKDGNPIGSRLHEYIDIGGSGGVARNLFDWPAGLNYETCWEVTMCKSVLSARTTRSGREDEGDHLLKGLSIRTDCRPGHQHHQPAPYLHLQSGPYSQGGGGQGVQDLWGRIVH